MLRHVEAIWRRAHTVGSRRIHWLTTGLILVFSGVVLGLMLWYYLPTLLTYRWQLQVLPLILSFAIYALDLLLAILGWSIIMGQLAPQLDFREHFRIYSVTLVAGRIPGAPWHLVGRVALYKRLGVSGSVTSVAAGLETILIIVSGILSGALIGFSLPENMQQHLVWLSPILVIGLGLMHPSAVRKVLQWLGHTQMAVRLRYRDMLLLLGLYVLVWQVGGGVLYMMILALYPLPWTQLPGVIGAWGLSGVVASLIFLSPTSLGIKEITLSLLLGLFIPVGLAVVIAILMRLYLTAAEFVWAIAASRL
jgi:glycosyltransferase 2 family protein